MQRARARSRRVEPDRFLKMRMTLRPIIRGERRKMHTRNTKALWAASMLTLLIGGYLVFGSIVHPDNNLWARAVGGSTSQNSADATKPMPGNATLRSEEKRYNEML